MRCFLVICTAEKIFLHSTRNRKLSLLSLLSWFGDWIGGERGGNFVGAQTSSSARWETFLWLTLKRRFFVPYSKESFSPMRATKNWEITLLGLIKKCDESVMKVCWKCDESVIKVWKCKQFFNSGQSVSTIQYSIVEMFKILLLPWLIHEKERRMIRISAATIAAAASLLPTTMIRSLLSSLSSSSQLHATVPLFALAPTPRRTPPCLLLLLPLTTLTTLSAQIWRRSWGGAFCEKQ